jgi:hypothetical protein
MPRGNVLALLFTLLVVGVVGIWAWNGLKSPPLSETRGIVTTPAGWQLMSAGSFTFYAPNGVVVRQAERAGLVYGDILGPNTCLRYSVGRSAAIVADKRAHANYTETAITIDGRPGVVRKAVLDSAELAQWFSECNGTIYIGLLIPNALPDGSAVAIDGTTMNEDVRDQVETIFKSVRFTAAR